MAKKSVTQQQEPGRPAPAWEPGTHTRSRILLVDDHPIVREGVAARLNEEPDLEVSALAADAHEALEKVLECKPDIIVTDLSLGGRPGLELVKDLAVQHPSLPVLVLSIHDEVLWAERVLRAGARGYIMKSQATQRVVDAVRRVLAGGIWVSETIDALVLNRFAGRRAASAGSALESLTDRELEIYQMVGHGLTVREIAAKLSLSAKTVEVHRENIKNKLQLKSAMDLVRHAVTHMLNES